MRICKYWERKSWCTGSCVHIEVHAPEVRLNRWTVPKACPLRDICKYREEQK